MQLINEEKYDLLSKSEYFSASFCHCCCNTYHINQII